MRVMRTPRITPLSVSSSMGFPGADIFSPLVVSWGGECPRFAPAARKIIAKLAAMPNNRLSWPANAGHPAGFCTIVRFTRRRGGRGVELTSALSASPRDIFLGKLDRRHLGGPHSRAMTPKLQGPLRQRQ